MLKIKTNQYIYVLIAMILITWIVLSVNIFLMNASWDEKSNIFDSINSFLSTLVLMGTVYAIYMQRIELQLQRKELTNTSKSQVMLKDIELAKFMTLDEEIAKVYFHGANDDIDNYNVFIYANLLVRNTFHEFENDYINLDEIKNIYEDAFSYKNGFLSKYWSILIKSKSVQERIKKYNQSEKDKLSKFEIYQGFISNLYYDSLKKES